MNSFANNVSNIESTFVWLLSSDSYITLPFRYLFNIKSIIQKQRRKGEDRRRGEEEGRRRRGGDEDLRRREKRKKTKRYDSVAEGSKVWKTN